MWLDELNDLVEKLQERINKHKEILANSESTTRYALIDPLLTKIGWDLSDPSQVRTEHVSQSKKRLDYAMFNDGKVCLVVEAKALGKPLDDGEPQSALDQAFTYTWREACEYLVVTDGNLWQGYHIKEPGGPDEVRRLNFCVDGESRGNDGPQRRIMDLFWLWPGNFKGEAARPNLHQPVGQGASVAGQPRSPVPQRPPTGATPLPQFRYETGMKPRRLLFANDEATEVKSWANIQVAVVEWLVGNRRMKNLPVRNNGRAVLVSRTPKKANGSDFGVPKRVGKNYWVDTNQSAIGHLKKAEQILKACGVDPQKVRVELR